MSKSPSQVTLQLVSKTQFEPKISVVPSPPPSGAVYLLVIFLKWDFNSMLTLKISIFLSILLPIFVLCPGLVLTSSTLIILD